MRFSPIYHPKSTWLNSKEHYPLWQEAEKLNSVFNYYILPHQMPMLEDMAGRKNIVVENRVQLLRFSVRRRLIGVDRAAICVHPLVGRA